MVWLFLIIAIILEVGAALSLRVATNGKKLFFIAVVIGYLGAFFFLTQVLSLGLGIGVAYGIWAASGVALTAVASKFHLLSYGLAVILGFIGAKMLLIDLYKIPVPVSLGVVAAILVTTMVLSLKIPPKREAG